MTARLFNLGFIGDFLSRTALVGFLTGVGIQVAIGQLSGMFGISSSGNNTLPPLLEFISNVPETSIQTLAVSAAVVAVILTCRRISKKIPGALIAVVGTIIASNLLDFSTLGIPVVGEVPKGLPTVSFPTFYIQDVPLLLGAAVTCFIVIIAQSTATARAYSVKCSETLHPNKDIIGLGLANLTAGFTGTFVVNGSPTKTQVALDSGARSQLATLITAAITLFVIMFLTKPLSFLPNATLASIVFLIGLEMVNIAGLKDIYNEVPSEFVLALITLLTVVIFSVLWGIIIAVILSILLHLSHSYRPNNSILIRNERGEWEFSSVAPGKYTEKGLIVYRFNRDLYYANADKLMKEVMELVKTAKYPVEWVVLDSGGFNAVDYTSIQVLKELKRSLEKLNIVFAISSVLPGLKEQFERSGLIHVFGEDNLYRNVDAALKSFETRKKGS
jgi:MFS superfamily sulfate permease-like transporter